MVYEDVSFGFNISDGSTVVGHFFVRRVSIRSTIKTLSDFPHVWTFRIGHCVLEKTFLTSVLASLIVLVASLQASIHSWRFWWIVRRRRFWVHILARTCGIIQGLDFLLGLDFPTWVVVAEMRMSLKRETRRDKLGSSGRLHIFDLTSFVKQDQSTSFLLHRANLVTAGLQQILWLSSIIIGRWSELPIDSASLQDAFADQLLPQEEMLGVLSLPVIRQVQVAQPPLRICRWLSRVQSRILWPRWFWGWKESHIWECPLRSPRMSEEGPGLIKKGSNEVCWVEVFGRYTLQSSSQVDLVVLRRMDRVSIPALSKECSFSNTLSVRMKIRRPPPRMLFQSFRVVA